MKQDILLKKLREGDLSAYQFLFDEYYTWLYNYLLKLSCDPQLSEDLTQDTMLHIWEKRKALVITTSLKNYLFKSCHNQFLMHLRKEKRNRTLLDQIRWEAVFEVYQDNMDSEESDSRFEKLQVLIEMLPPRCREVFIQGKLQNKKYRHIAEDMGISVKTVEAQMSKALSYLRQHAHNLLL